jgi:hypothetical protein
MRCNLPSSIQIYAREKPADWPIAVTSLQWCHSLGTKCRSFGKKVFVAAAPALHSCAFSISSINLPWIFSVSCHWFYNSCYTSMRSVGSFSFQIFRLLDEDRSYHPLLLIDW